MPTMSAPPSPDQLRLPVDGGIPVAINAPGLTSDQDREVDHLVDSGHTYGEAFDSVLGTSLAQSGVKLTLADKPPSTRAASRSQEEIDRELDRMDGMGLDPAYVRRTAGLDD